jgi:peptide/nickel transport system substrate-binding protein
VDIGERAGDHRDAGLIGTRSRRDFLRLSAEGAALAGVGGLLAACGSGSTSTTPAAPAGKAKRGGTITFASTGGGSADTLDGNNCVTNLDFARAPQLYDTLMEFDRNSVPQLALAEEVMSNSGATEWTIRVRKGVEFHNGKPFTIDDVLYTFNRIVKNKYSAASGLASFDLKNAKKLDQYTARFPMHDPFSIVPITLVGNGEMSIVPEGYDPKHPVGTGPFKYQSFTPGNQSVFTRNPNYYIHGQPYIDKLVIVDYADETAQVNALLSGQATCIDQLSVASVATVRSGGRIANIWPGPGWVPFTMRVDVAPFNDVRVRQAMRLVVDRPQVQKVVYGGFGYLGNDVFGRTDPQYDSALPQRHQDIAQAKFLLKKAGHEGLNTTLVTGPIKTGAVEMAQVLKQQASAAGININLNNITSGAFYGPNYLKWTFAQDWWSGYPYLRQAGYSMVPGAPWDETHWAAGPYGAQYLRIYKEALSTVDKPRQQELAHELMKMDYDNGGYIIPAFNPIIVGQAPSLKGVVSQKTGDPWIDWRFRMMWLSS